MQRALLALLILLCTACAARAPRTPSAGANPEFPPAPTTGVAEAAKPAASPGATQQQAGLLVANAAAFVEQTRVLLPGWNEADAEIGLAHAALRLSDGGAARAHAEEASALADAALSDYYTRRANEELRKSYGYTGLDDAQILQLRAAEETLVAGNSRLAYGRLRMLNRQLEKRIKTYAVAAGESLWIIAAKPEVYANPLLWPLIWQDNLAVIPDPDRLRKGQVLRLRQHPSIEEVAGAVQQARGRLAVKAGVTPLIGEIRPAD